MRQGNANNVHEKDSRIMAEKPFLNHKREIINLLRNSDSGLTIADITKKVGTTRHTASVVLAELKGANLVEVRKIGIAKLHNWRCNVK